MPTVEELEKVARSKGMTLWEHAKGLLKELVNKAQSSSESDGISEFHSDLKENFPNIPELHDLPLPGTGEQVDDYVNRLVKRILGEGTDESATASSVPTTSQGDETLPEPSRSPVSFSPRSKEDEEADKVYLHLFSMVSA